MKIILLALLTFILVSTSTIAEDKPYSGFYLGADFGSRHYTKAEDTIDPGTAAIIGLRKQTEDDIVWGIEASMVNNTGFLTEKVEETTLSGIWGKAYGRSLFFVSAGASLIEPGDYNINSAIPDNDFFAGAGFEFKLFRYYSINTKARYYVNTDDPTLYVGFNITF